MLAGKNGMLSWQPVPFPVLGGFATLQFGADSVVVKLHAHDGTVLYIAPRIARRGRVLEATLEAKFLLEPQLTPILALTLPLLSCFLLVMFLKRRKPSEW